MKPALSDEPMTREMSFFADGGKKLVHGIGMIDRANIAVRKDRRPDPRPP